MVKLAQGHFSIGLDGHDEVSIKSMYIGECVGAGIPTICQYITEHEIIGNTLFDHSAQKLMLTDQANPLSLPGFEVQAFVGFFGSAHKRRVNCWMHCDTTPLAD